MPRVKKSQELVPLDGLPDGTKLPERRIEPSTPHARSVEDIVADQRRNDALCRKLFAKPAKGAR